MLVLTRTSDQEIRIGDDIVIRVLDVRGDRVRIGIDAPSEIPVHRQEVYAEIERTNQAALKVAGAGLAGARALVEKSASARDGKKKASPLQASSRQRNSAARKPRVDTEVSHGS